MLLKELYFAGKAKNMTSKQFKGVARGGPSWPVLFMVKVLCFQWPVIISLWNFFTPLKVRKDVLVTSPVGREEEQQNYSKM